MSVKCECGEDVSGEICMLCGRTVQQEYQQLDMVLYEQTMPGQHKRDDDKRGTFGNYTIDLETALHLMDRHGNTIYKLPHHTVTSSTKFGALCIVSEPHGVDIKLKGKDAKTWMRALSYQKYPVVWHLTGSGGCRVECCGSFLGITPCVARPPFSWKAFKSGSYTITLRRRGIESKQMNLKTEPGQYKIRFDKGTPIPRHGVHIMGDDFVLNDSYMLVIDDEGVPHLTDRKGTMIYRMPEASVKVWRMTRGATISWPQAGMYGMISIDIKCDDPVKYGRLSQLLSVPDVKNDTAAFLTRPPANKDAKNNTPPLPDAGQEATPPQLTLTQPPPEPFTPEYVDASPDKKSRWLWRKRGSRMNRGTYEGVDLCVTKNDLNTRLGRFDGYAFEAVCANLLASMGYKIVKGYDGRSGRMKGPTRADKGVDIIATRKKDRVIVQCKMWKEQCGGPDVNKTIGSATTEDGTAVLMIATGGFTSQAYQIAKESSMPVDLWDWDSICKNMRKHLL